MSEELQGKLPASLQDAKCNAVMDEGHSLLQKQFESFGRKIDTVLRERSSLLTSYAGKIENYHNEITKLMAEKEKSRIEIRNIEEWCEKEKKTCAEIEEEILKKLEEISLVEHEIEREKKKDKELRKLLDSGDPINEKVVELNKASSYFQQNLALKLKRTDLDGELVFIFTHIDCNDRSQEFEFGVKVVEDCYIVTKCEPAVPNIKELLKTLNETNNLQKFVCELREAFKNSCVNKNC